MSVTENSKASWEACRWNESGYQTCHGGESKLTVMGKVPLFLPVTSQFSLSTSTSYIICNSSSSTPLHQACDDSNVMRIGMGWPIMNLWREGSVMRELNMALTKCKAVSVIENSNDLLSLSLTCIAGISTGTVSVRHLIRCAAARSISSKC